jgi:4-amino-4-deoxy-L-arabinose transferase-like glycosyltransferase
MSDATRTTPPTGPTRRRHYVWLALIMVLGLALRAGYLNYAIHTPEYTWEDPDGYIERARRLVRSGEWRWTFEAATFRIGNRRHALPPGFSVFLSFFLLYPGFPLSAQIAFMLLGIASLALIFELGRLVHSPRAGLIAAAASAVAVHNIIGVWSTSQEGLYVPLILLAFILVGRATLSNSPPWRFAIAGLVFGLAALTRSMPLFFIVPAAVVLVFLAPTRRAGSAWGVALVVGFLLPTLPYVVALSTNFGEVALIDTHGSIHQTAVVPGASAPGVGETAAAIWRSMAAAPVEFVRQCLERARTLLHVNGGRILQIYVVTDSYPMALAWKTVVHTGTDLLVILAATLAPLGSAVCRNPRVAVVWLLWAAVNVGIASVGGFSGARLRAPFEPVLIVLAAAMVSGTWVLRWRWIAVAAAISVVIASAMLPQVPRSLAGWPDYGVEWPSIWKRGNGRIIGPAGVNIPAFRGLAEFTLTREPSTSPQGPATAVQIRGAGVALESRTIAPGESQQFRIWWPRQGLAFLQIDGRSQDGRTPRDLRDLRISVPRP